MKQAATVPDPTYAQACEEYRQLCRQCESMIAQRLSVSELIEAIEYKCHRLGDLVRELERRSRA